jgi:hypothetical protein
MVSLSFCTSGLVAAEEGPPPEPFIVNMTPASSHSETALDGEPFLAVNPNDPDIMFATAFTPNSGGVFTKTAPIYYTIDAGRTWEHRSILDSEYRTRDVTVATGKVPKKLFAALLRFPNYDFRLSVQRWDSPTGVLATELMTKTWVDQPYIHTTNDEENDVLLIGYNNVKASATKTASIDVSKDGGASFSTTIIEHRETPGRDGAPVRVSAAPDGTVYAAFQGWRQKDTKGHVTSDIVVVRDDSHGASQFKDLDDPLDKLTGRVVLSTPILVNSEVSNLGCERVGSALSIAADPTNSDIVYLAWGDQSNEASVQTLRVRRSADRGKSWSSDLVNIPDATNPALAVSETGVVAFAYQRYDQETDLWHTVISQSKDAFATRQDVELGRTPDESPPCIDLPYVGDYMMVLAVGDVFRGVFAANNDPDMNHFPSGVVFQRPHDFGIKQLQTSWGSVVEPSIDPYFYEVGVLP